MPQRVSKVDSVLVLFSTDVGHAARMLIPGPIISGFSMPGLSGKGPLDEMAATAGARSSPNIVPLNKNEAAGVDVEFM